MYSHEPFINMEEEPQGNLEQITWIIRIYVCLSLSRAMNQSVPFLSHQFFQLFNI
uniref:Uncharacterized protein n=1 Tax=Anguilla anguilla TaxID=7936 RepID=A0A0E9RLT9_ANGAN